MYIASGHAHSARWAWSQVRRHRRRYIGGGSYHSDPLTVYHPVCSHQTETGVFCGGRCTHQCVGQWRFQPQVWPQEVGSPTGWFSAPKPLQVPQPGEMSLHKNEILTVPFRGGTTLWHPCESFSRFMLHNYCKQMELDS